MLRWLGCAILLAACGIAGAQSRNASLPDAPNPDTPAVRATLSNGPAPFSATAQAGAAGAPLPAGAVSLYTVVDLALRNSKAVRVAEAERLHAHGTEIETRDAYIPNFALGSGLGYSYGFPLGNPTLFNVTSTSLLYSFSQHDYIRAAKSSLRAATLHLKSVRQQVILDASTSYLELDKTLAQIAALQQAVADGDKLVAVVRERMHAGVDSELALTQARLTRARIELREIQMEDHAGELREHIANLTGLPAESIEPAASSVPALPDLDVDTLMRAAGQSPSVQAAYATAQSRQFSALGDKNQNYRPTVNMAFQYARFAPFNGYNLYYNHFNYDNIGIGIQAVWPLFDPIRRDKAVESKAEATRAQQAAELAKIQASESNLALWHSLRELKAEQKVSELQQQVDQATLASMETQLNQSSSTNGTAPVSPQQADETRIEERTSYVDLRDAQYNVERVELDLLQAIGGLEDWAKQSGQTPPAAPGTTLPSPSLRSPSLPSPSQ